MSDYNKKMNEKYQSVNNLWKDIKVPFITRVEAEKAKNNPHGSRRYLFFVTIVLIFREIFF